MSLPARTNALQTALVTLRQRSRERVPFGVRVSLRRVPAIARWLMVERLPRGEALPWRVVERSSPLRRETIGYGEALQAGKERNVALAASLLDGIVLAAGGKLSWRDEVGPPLASRGFVPGPELHEGELCEGLGGGACQVANLLLYLAVHAGLEVLERHRHAFDLFPDDHRDVPFGLGATVFWPHRDLVLRNPHPYAVHLHLGVQTEAGRKLLRGVLTAERQPEARWEVIERDHRYETTADGVFRCNTLVRVRHSTDGRRTEQPLASHRARVLYAVPSPPSEAP